LVAALGADIVAVGPLREEVVALALEAGVASTCLAPFHPRLLLAVHALLRNWVKMVPYLALDAIADEVTTRPSGLAEFAPHLLGFETVFITGNAPAGRRVLSESHLARIAEIWTPPTINALAILAIDTLTPV
jgi:hypothetical protein